MGRIDLSREVENDRDVVVGQQSEATVAIRIAVLRAFAIRSPHRCRFLPPWHADHRWLKLRHRGLVVLSPPKHRAHFSWRERFMNPSDPHIQAVAFDLDGLMFNTEDIYIDVATVMLQRRGRALDMRLIRQMMGLPARTALPLMIQWYGLDDDVASLERETQEVFDQLLPESLAPLPGLLELIRVIDSLQLPKAIATSSRRRYLDRILELAALPTRFDFYLTADDVEQGKPHPEIYLKAAAQFGIAPGVMLVLEDSEHGCRAAVAAGAIACAVPGAHNADAAYPAAALRIERLNDQRLLARLRPRDPA